MDKIKFPFDTKEFFKKCVKHKNFPKNDFEKQAVLTELIKEFKAKEIYKEEEVNNLIKKYFEDFALIRRELINFGYMQRNPLTCEYWVVKKVLSKEDLMNNTLLMRHAKDYGVLKKNKKS